MNLRDNVSQIRYSENKSERKFTGAFVFVIEMAFLSQIVKEEDYSTWKGGDAFCVGKKVSLEGTLNRGNICLMYANA